MKKYKAILEIGGETIVEEFEIDDNPIEYLWAKYGMSSYIDSIYSIEEEAKKEKE